MARHLPLPGPGAGDAIPSDEPVATMALARAPRGVFGGVPPVPSAVPLARELVQEPIADGERDRDSGDCVLDVEDRCPDDTEGEDGCPSEVHIEPEHVIERDGRRLIVSSSIIIF